MFDESIVQASGGQLVRLPELSARLMVGDHGPVRPYYMLRMTRLTMII